MASRPFLNVNTRKELATVLECKDAALDFVSLCSPEKPCKAPGCDYPAVDGNYHMCVMHGRSWIPTKRKGTDGKTKHERGHLLLGYEFSVANNPVKRVCSCDMASCKGIGYTSSLFTLPSEPATLETYLRNSGVMFTDEKKAKIRKNPRNFNLAYWHFDPGHRYYDEKDEKWHLVKSESYVDNDNDKKVWRTPNHPPPNNSLDKFIDETSLKQKVRPQERWIVRNLPPWFEKLRRVDRLSGTPGKNPETSPLKKKSKNHVSPENFSENITHNINYRRAIEATRAQTELEEVVMVLQTRRQTRQHF